MKVLLYRVGTKDNSITSAGIEGYTLESHQPDLGVSIDIAPNLEKEDGDTKQILRVDSDDACVTFTNS